MIDYRSLIGDALLPVKILTVKSTGHGLFRHGIYDDHFVVRIESGSYLMRGILFIVRKILVKRTLANSRKILLYFVRRPATSTTSAYGRCQRYGKFLSLESL